MTDPGNRRSIPILLISTEATISYRNRCALAHIKIQEDDMHLPRLHSALSRVESYFPPPIAMKHSISLLLFVVVLLGSCRGPAQLRPTFIKLSNQTEQLPVRAAIVRAVNKCGWTVELDKRGELIAQYLNGRYRSKIRISYGNERIDFNYLDSDHLNYSKIREHETISRHYVKWIAKLRKSVAGELRRNTSIVARQSKSTGDPISSLEALLALNPADAGARESLAIHYAREGRRSKHRTTLEAGLEWIETTEYATFLAANLSASAEERENYARLIIGRSPNNPFGHWHLGISLRDRGLLEEAKDALEQCIALDSYAWEVRYELAHIQLRLGYPGEAVHLLEAALVRAIQDGGEPPSSIIESLAGIYEQSPGHEAAGIRLGAISSREKSLRVELAYNFEALDQVPKAIDERPHMGLSFHPDDERLITEIEPGSIAAAAGVMPGDSLQYGSRKVASEGDLDRGSDVLSEGDLVVLMVERKGRIYELKSQVTSVLAAINEGRRAWRDGLAAYRDGRMHDSHDLLQDAMEKMGGHNLLLRMQLLEIRAMAGDPQGALHAAKGMRANETFRNTRFWVVLGRLHERAGEPGNELEAYRRAAADAPASAEYPSLEGLVHLREGRLDQARERLARARLLHGESNAEIVLARRLKAIDHPNSSRGTEKDRRPSIFGQIFVGVAAELLGVSGADSRNGGGAPSEPMPDYGAYQTNLQTLNNMQ